MTKSPYLAGRLETGLTLLIGSFVLGLVALGLFLYAYSLEGAPVYTWREAALVIAAPALAVFVWSLNIAMPAQRTLRALSHAALVLCGAATVMFAIHYPDNFNVQDGTQRDYLPLDLGIYMVGLAVILASSVTSVMAHYIRFVTMLEPEQPARKYEVPDWVVQKDVEDAMKGSKLQWGLGDENAEEIPLPTLSPHAQVKGSPSGRTIELDGNILENARTALVETRPVLHARREAPPEWTDDNTAALAALQKARRANPKAFRMRTGFWSTLFGMRSRPVLPAMNGASHVDAAPDVSTTVSDASEAPAKTRPAAKRTTRRRRSTKRARPAKAKVAAGASGSAAAGTASPEAANAGSADGAPTPSPPKKAAAARKPRKGKA